MDCRNITTKPPVTNGHTLEKMLELQAELAKEYAKIEKIDATFPVNLNVKKNQVILKDFSARVTEEIAEGYESYELMIHALSSVGFNKDLLEDDMKEMIYNHLQNANEEMADAMGFFLELLLYIGISVEDIKNHPIVQDMVESREVRDLDFSDSLMLCQNVGYHLILKRIGGSDNIPNTFPIFDPTEITPGYCQVSKNHFDLQPMMAWEVAYHLNIARNYLKNKPWKRSQQLSDESMYKEEVIESFLVFCGMLLFNHIYFLDIYTLYWKKNQVNHFRIKSNY